MRTHNAIHDARGIDAGVFVEDETVITCASRSIIVPNTAAVATTYTLVGNAGLRIACLLSRHEPWFAIDDLVLASGPIVSAIANTASASTDTSIRADLRYAIQVILSNAAIINASVIVEGTIIWVARANIVNVREGHNHAAAQSIADQCLSRDKFRQARLVNTRSINKNSLR